MGTLFRYLSDDVARGIEEGECAHCQRLVALFPIQAAIEDNEWTHQSDCPEELCSDCIRRLPLRLFAPRKGECVVQRMINDHYKKGTLDGD
jgi:hypothetical protein